MPVQKKKAIPSKTSILIVEPNDKLNFPYAFLYFEYKISRACDVSAALSSLDKVKPAMVFLSASFSVAQSLRFLEGLKNFCKVRLIPVVMVVDMSHRINFVPGLSWGRRIAVIDTGMPQDELYSTVDRLFKL